jgi:hypothetical protein
MIWKLLGRRQSRTRRRADRAWHIRRWRFSAAPEETVDLFAIPRFPHRLETDINRLAAASFRILKIQELRPTVATA